MIAAQLPSPSMMLSPFAFSPALAEYAVLMPEIIVATTMVVLLLMPVLPVMRPLTGRSATAISVTAIIGLLAAAVAAGWQLVDAYAPWGPVLGSMVTHDPASVAFKVVLHVFAALVVALWWRFSRHRTAIADSPDFLALILGAVIGMSLMSMASNLIMIVLAIEAASLPSYALVGFDKHTRRGAEASLKYVLFGAAASSMMIFGASMFYAAFGTLDLATLGTLVADGWTTGYTELQPGVAAGFIVGWMGLMAGIGFKLAAVPLHFWCPDAFEAAPIEVTNFLSVASKGAAIVLLLRAVAAFGTPVATVDADAATAIGGVNPADMLAWAIGLGGLVTAFWGNLTAYTQTNLKRLLAYSSIAHAGYMMMAAGLATAMTDSESSAALTHALLFYVLVYAFMNFGAFAVVAAVADASGGDESIDAVKGLIHRNPLLALAFGLFLMGLFGLPGTGGFWAKVMLGIQMAEQGTWGYVLVGGLVVNTLLSLYFYLRPIIAMTLSNPLSGPMVEVATAPRLAVGPFAGGLIVVAAAGVLGIGVLGPDRVPSGWLRTQSVIMPAIPAPPVVTVSIDLSPAAPLGTPSVQEDR